MESPRHPDSAALCRGQQSGRHVSDRRSFLLRRPRFAAFLFGVALTVAVTVVLEFVFWGINACTYPGAGIARRSSLGLWQLDGKLGVAPGRNARHTQAAYKGDELVFSTTYTIDAHRRRIVSHTPPLDLAPRRQFLLCFGCSFMFGIGVEDDQTLPFYLAQNAPGHHVYNYAFGTYGPHHTLAMLEEPGFSEHVEEDDGIAIYLYLVCHCRRALGSMRMVSSFGRNAPCYELDGHGRVVYQGSFAETRPWRGRLYDLLARDQILKFFRIDFPVMSARANAAFAAEVLNAAFAQYQRDFGNDRFYVVVYPAPAAHEQMFNEHARVLEKRGLKVLNYAGLFDRLAPGMLIEHEVHPTP